jgi:hypothetical protein
MTDDSTLNFLLKQMAEDHQPELPSPGLIWWRAQILRKQQEKDRIERPMIIMRWLAAAVCAAAAVMLAGNWGVFRTATAGTYPWLLPLVVILTIAVSVVSMVSSLRSPASKS